jgi:hypothetical protein
MQTETEFVENTLMTFCAAFTSSGDWSNCRRSFARVIYAVDGTNHKMVGHPVYLYEQLKDLFDEHEGQIRLVSVTGDREVAGRQVFLQPR